MTQTPVSYQGSRLTRRQRITFLVALILVASHFSLAYISEAAPFLSLRAFAAGKTEADYPDSSTWIADAPHG